MEGESTICQSQKAVVSLVIIAALVGAFIGGIMGFNANQTATPSVVTPTGTNSADYQAGFAAARAKLIERGVIPDPAVMGEVDTTFIGGTVKSVSGNTLVVEVASQDILADAVNRTVTVTAETVINSLVNKTPEVINKEMEDFMAILNAEKADGTESETVMEPPQPFARVKTTMQGIKVGDFVSVKAMGVIPATGDIAAKTIEVSVISTPEEDIPSPQ